MVKAAVLLIRDLYNLLWVLRRLSLCPTSLEEFGKRGSC